MPGAEPRLGGEDAAWLHTDTADNHMIVTGLIELERSVDPDALAALVRERLLRHARFRSVVVEPRLRIGRPRLRLLPEVDLAQHLLTERLRDGRDETLRRRVGELAGLPLPRARPLWRLHLLQRPGAGTALLFRVHHAIADGFALQAVLLSLCDGVVTAIPRSRPSTSALAEAGAALRRPWRLPRLLARFIAALVRLLTWGRDPDGVLKGELGAAKRVAWTRPLSLARVHDVAARAGVTVNDLLLEAIAGALRRYCAMRGARPRRSVKAMIPVNLRTPEEALDALGNFFGLVILPLPVHMAGAARRLRVVKRAMDAIKHTPQAVVGLGILQLMGRAPRLLERLGVVFFTRKASLILTNVAGPTSRPSLAGVPIARVLFWVPQSGRVALGISALSFAGDVVVGVMSDAGRIPDPEAIAGAIEDGLRRSVDGDAFVEGATPRAVAEGRRTSASRAVRSEGGIPTASFPSSA